MSLSRMPPYPPGHGVDVGDPVAAEVKSGEAGEGLQGGDRDGGQLVGDQTQGVQGALQSVECLGERNIIKSSGTSQISMFAQMLRNHKSEKIPRRNS